MVSLPWVASVALAISLAGGVDYQNVTIENPEQFGRDAFAKGSYEEAESNFRRVLGELQAKDASDGDLVQAIANLAEVLRLKGSSAEAEELYKRALGIIKASGSDSKRLEPTLLLGLARLFQETGR